MTRVLDIDSAPDLHELRSCLIRIESDPVRQQQLIEMLTANHCLRMGSTSGALTVAAGIYKHVRQLIEQNEPA
jgi:hypothetical protein